MAIFCGMYDFLIIIIIIIILLLLLLLLFLHTVSQKLHFCNH